MARQESAVEQVHVVAPPGAGGATARFCLAVEKQVIAEVVVPTALLARVLVLAGSRGLDAVRLDEAEPTTERLLLHGRREGASYSVDSAELTGLALTTSAGALGAACVEGLGFALCWLADQPASALAARLEVWSGAASIAQVVADVLVRQVAVEVGGRLEEHLPSARRRLRLARYRRWCEAMPSS